MSSFMFLPFLLYQKLGVYCNCMACHQLVELSPLTTPPCYGTSSTPESDKTPPLKPERQTKHRPPKLTRQRAFRLSPGKSVENQTLEKLTIDSEIEICYEIVTSILANKLYDGLRENIGHLCLGCSEMNGSDALFLSSYFADGHHLCYWPVAFLIDFFEDTEMLQLMPTNSEMSAMVFEAIEMEDSVSKKGFFTFLKKYNKHPVPIGGERIKDYLKHHKSPFLQK